MPHTKFTVSIAKEIIEILRTAFKEEVEIIPNYTEKEINDVVKCCQRIYQSYDGIELYPNFYEKAAALLFNLNKGHYLVNGNKRVSLAMFTIFVHIESKKYIIQNKNFISFLMKLIENIASCKITLNETTSLIENQLKKPRL